MSAPRFPWKEILTEHNLRRAGEDANTAVEFASKLSEIVGYDICEGTLQMAYKRRADAFGLPKSPTHYYLKKTANAPRLEDIRFPLSDDRRAAIRKASRWIVTAAVNDTPIDADAWASITRYAKLHDAPIIVIPLRYKNPTTRRDDNVFDEQHRWAPEVDPYLCDELIKLRGGWVVAGNVRVQATATNPLQGLHTLTRGASAVFGHPQLAMDTVPTPQSDAAKIVTTSMAITQPVYSTTKAGVRGEFHHSTGAVVVEHDRSGAYMRHLICSEGGEFYDVAGGRLRLYTPTGDRASTAEYLVVSDEHAPFTHRQLEKGTYHGADSISGVCRPEWTIRHDAVDMYAINPHERNSAIKRVAAAKFGLDDLRGEMDAGASYVNRTTAAFTKNVFPWSNHPNEHLDRWLSSVMAPRDEPQNAEIWLELWTAIVKSMRKTPDGYAYDDPFSWYVRARLEKPARFLAADESFVIGGVELGQHGHLGPNGARGTRRNMSRIGIRSVIGHGHSPGIYHGCWQVGVTAPTLGYARGPSSWACCHVLGYAGGKRQAIFVSASGRWYAKTAKRRESK
jgi:hypothetical protein